MKMNFPFINVGSIFFYWCMVAERVKQKKEGETMASCRVSVDTAGGSLDECSR